VEPWWSRGGAVRDQNELPRGTWHAARLHHLPPCPRRRSALPVMLGVAAPRGAKKGGETCVRHTTCGRYSAAQAPDPRPARIGGVSANAVGASSTAFSSSLPVQSNKLQCSTAWSTPPTTIESLVPGTFASLKTCHDRLLLRARRSRSHLLRPSPRIIVEADLLAHAPLSPSSAAPRLSRPSLGTAPPLPPFRPHSRLRGRAIRVPDM
jgi:hypothetical protein